jgi:cyclohexyl-isocyanide hydratase
MTALDRIGPQHVFAFWIAPQVRLLGKSRDPMVTDRDSPSCPPSRWPTARRSSRNLAFERTRRGSLLARRSRSPRQLGDQSLLGSTGSRRHRAAARLAGDEPLGEARRSAAVGRDAVEGRVVEDRKRVTTGGITEGIGFGIRIAARLRGRTLPTHGGTDGGTRSPTAIPLGHPRVGRAEDYGRNHARHKRLNEVARAAARRRAKP